MCVAVALEREDWPRRSVWLDMRQEPDLACATSNFIRFNVSAVRQRRQSSAQLDDVSIAIVPFIEQRKIFNNLVDCSHGASYIGPRAAKAKSRAKSEPPPTADSQQILVCP